MTIAIMNKVTLVTIKKSTFDKNSWNCYYYCGLSLFKNTLPRAMVTHQKHHTTLLKKELFDCSHSPPEPYQCYICGFRTDLLVRFNEHSAADKELKLKLHTCEKCGFRTYSWLILTRHVNLECKGVGVRWTHNRPNLKLPLLSSWFHCEQCTYSSSKKGPMKAHILARHTPDSEIRWFYCDQCAYRAKQKGDLRKHIRRIHIREPIADRKFQCEKCPFKTKRKACLKKHLLIMHNGCNDGRRVVSGGGQFRCEQCSYSSNRIDNFKKHIIEKHTPPEKIDWFECGQCSYKAKRVSRLKEHVLLRHTALEDIKWFKCEQCSYKGKLKTNLRSHILTKHLSLEDVK